MDLWKVKAKKRRITYSNFICWLNIIRIRQFQYSRGLYVWLKILFLLDKLTSFSVTLLFRWICLVRTGDSAFEVREKKLEIDSGKNHFEILCLSTFCSKWKLKLSIGNNFYSRKNNFSLSKNASHCLESIFKHSQTLLVILNVCYKQLEQQSLSRI